MSNVTDADRKAAADILDEVSNLLDHVGIGQVADLIRDGEYDEHEVVSIVSRPRTAAEQAGYDRTVAEVVSWLRVDAPCCEYPDDVIQAELADAIEAGEHRRPA